MKQDTLPNSIAVRNSKTVVWANGMKWIPIFCANCGCDGGQVLEVDYERTKNHAFHLCMTCAERWTTLADTAITPDEVFWQKVHDESVEAFGRDLTVQETAEALKDGNHVLAKLAKDRHD